MPYGQIGALATNARYRGQSGHAADIMEIPAMFLDETSARMGFPVAS
jgi:hypothetical protein